MASAVATWHLSADRTVLYAKGRPNRSAGPAPIPAVGRLTAAAIVANFITSSFVMDITKPDASNTGPAAGGFTPTQIINGDYTLAAGELLENALIFGSVTMGSGSVLRGSRIVGGAPNKAVNWLVRVPAGLPVVPTVEFCDIGQSANIGYWMNCLVLAGSVNLRRNNIHDGVDFIKASGTQIDGDIAGNWFHDFSYHNDDNDQANSTPAFVSHNDGTQINGGINGYNFHGNNTEMYPSQTTSVGQPSSTVSVGWGCPITVSGSGVTQGLYVHHNWFSGGAAGVFQANAMPAAQGSISMGYIGQNRVAFDQFNFGNGSKYQIRYATAYTALSGETTDYFDGSLPSVTEAGIAGKLFALGTAGTSGIRRP